MHYAFIKNNLTMYLNMDFIESVTNTTNRCSGNSNTDLSSKREVHC